MWTAGNSMLYRDVDCQQQGNRSGLCVKAVGRPAMPDRRCTPAPAPYRRTSHAPVYAATRKASSAAEELTLYSQTLRVWLHYATLRSVPLRSAQPCA
eukprot:365994-Chlamydomonas_euryale.AAC.20